jgi:DNA-directed DNA polymerase III PolC
LAAPQANFLSIGEMARRFQSYLPALRNTLQITERCSFRLPLGQTHFPNPPLTAGESATTVLRQKALDGAKARYGSITSEIRERLDHELGIIQQCGYAALFLIVEEIIAFTRKKGIPFSSRGSAASSLVAYCLGITSPDPLKLNLYFERFLNPARASPPDIDTDLCSRRRDEVLNFVMQHFGDERVAMVATVNRFRERSALRETAKAYGLPPERIQELVERLPYRWFGADAATQKQPLETLRQAFPQSDIQHIIDQATQVLRKPRHLSIHPGGVVIAPGLMTDFVPTMLASKGLLVTQFDHYHIERLGLVKIDLLGIRGLSVLGDVENTLRLMPRLAQAQETSSEKLSGKPPAELEALPQEVPSEDTSVLTAQNPIPWPSFSDESSSDPLLEDLLREGRTIGCFQIESPGMRATLREINAHSLEDIMVALALYRPGPLTGGLKRSFVERYRAQQSGQADAYDHLHPSLAPLLGDTYGVILYQEQVLRIAHELAGFSLAEADLLRRAMSHFDPGKQMQTLQEKFILGVHQRQAIPAETAQRIWELMAAFAGYGFPKAHAASYAQIAWRAAWSKVHFPAIFMTAVLANWGGYYSQRVYLNEARRLGLSLRAPHINYAQQEFSLQFVDQQALLFMGLEQVRDLTQRTQKRMIAERPFHSLTDFLVRVDPRSQEAENLIRIGALDGLGGIPDLLGQIKKQDWKSGQFPMFTTSPTLQPAQRNETWPLAQVIADQETILGAAVIAHPLELAAERIKAAGAISTVEALQYVGQSVQVAGMRQTWRRGKNSRGDIYYFMCLEDLEGMLDVFIPGEVYRRYRHAFSKPGPWVIEGLLEPDPTSGECTLRAARVALLD